MKRATGWSFLVGLACLTTGIAVMAALILLRKPPAEALTQSEKSLSVEAIIVEPESVATEIVGYGQVRTLNEVPITAEVAGKVIEIYPDLEPGTRIAAGETLFVIDPRPYEAQAAESKAAVDQAASTIERMNGELKNVKDRIAAIERTRDLAQAQYDRLNGLLKEDVGTQADLDQAERAYVQARDEAETLRDEIEMYPLRIEEMTKSLEAAKARYEMAAISVEKTRVASPFNARVKSVSLERDQFVSPGSEIMVLADDSMLEIPVKLSSRDVHDWLPFDAASKDGGAWFAGLEQVECQIYWVEAPDARTWTGTLSRVESFDPSVRTITAAIRLNAEQAVADGFPLVEGMFCKVSIPGKHLDAVYRVPLSAITLDNSVYVARDGRLKSVPVRVARTQGSHAYITEGLSEGDTVITTKLVNPLDNTLLDVQVRGETSAAEATS
ncbi:MAG: acriflavin resistance protein [Candidatus Hydrogenedentota bacterium]